MTGVWLIGVGIAAILNALMDKVENEGFYQSIFRDKKPEFWYKRASWNKAKNIAGWKFDSWHSAKSLMLVFLCLSIVLYKPLWNWKIDFGIAGMTWVIVFNLFYNKIFKA